MKPIQLVQETIELSEGAFSGPCSTDMHGDLAGLIPRGTYSLVGNCLAREQPRFAVGQEIGATVELFPTAAGGRRGPTPQSEWRVVVRVRGKPFDCRLYIGGSRSLHPGEAAGVRVRFLSPESARALGIGEEFEIWEGRAVGRGVAQIAL